MKGIGKAVLLFIFAVLTTLASGQVATGVPPFSTIEGGPFDRVNLGNLNVEFAIPIVSKPGRGIPFGFSLVYNSSVWAVGSVNGHSAWVPTGGTFFGWQGTGTITPYVTYTYTTTTNLCGPTNGGPPPYSYQQAIFGNTYVYHDQWGGQHSFTVSQTYYSIYSSPGIANSCPPNGPQPNTSQSALAGDSSGYTLTLSPPSGTSISAYVLDRSGNKITTPTVAAGGAAPQGGYTIQDPNGNQLTYNGTNRVFTDTMGSTVLSIAYPPSGGMTYTYSAPGGSAAYTVWFMLVPIQTKFGCSGVAEFSNVGQQNNTYLVYNIALPDGTSYSFSYETTPGNSNYYTGRIKSVTLPTGGQITYNYTGSNYGINCSDGSTNGLTRTLTPGGTWTYTRTLVSGSHWQTKVSSPPDPQNAGSAKNDTVIDFQKNSSTGNFVETQRQMYQGLQSGGNLLLTTVTCWNGTTSNCTNTAVSTPITERAVTTKFPNNGQTSKVDAFYNNRGLLTEADQYAYGASGTPGPLVRKTQISYASLGNNILDHPASVTVTDGNTNLLSNTTYAYDEYSTYPLQPSSGTPQHVSVSGSRGNATTISSTVIGSTTLSRHVDYFDTGKVYQSIDVNGATTTYNYPDATSTCGNTFPTSITPPISSLATSMTWNCSGGAVTTATDANGNSTTTAWTDPAFWRPASVVAPYTSNTSTTTTTFSYTHYNSSSKAFANTDTQTLFNNGTSVVEQLTTVNQFGQPVYSQQREGPSSSNWDSAQVLYDSFLRAGQGSMPCVYTSTSFTDQNQACPTAATTTSTLDALGRVTKTTNGGGGYVSYTYSQNDVKQAAGPAPSGENLKQKQLEYDALGRLTSVCELTSLTGYVTCGQTVAYNGYFTTYAYGVNASGYLTSTVTQGPSGSQQTRVYVNDLVGRMVSEQNPENGTTQYFYDNDPGTVGAACSTVVGTNWQAPYNGDLVKKYDAKGNTTCYTYDAIHRVTGIYYSGPDSGNTPTKAFVYDSASFNGSAMANPKGRLVEAYTGLSTSKSTDEFFSYSVRGELLDTWQCTPHSGTNGCASVSNYYHVSAGFWENGALKALSSSISGLPNQNYGVDAMGRTNAVSASVGQNPVTSMSYDLVHFQNSLTFGSGDFDTFYLDGNTGRQTKYVFTVNGATDTGQTTWNPNGSLQSFQITDNIPGTSDTQTCNYAHDDLSRISSVNCLNGSTNKWNQQFAYDAFGNITKNSSGPGITFLPTYSSSTNWLTALPGVTPTTDANGQMTYDGSHNYTWDAAGKMHSVDASPANCSTSGQCLTYDALGRMVEKTSGSTYTQIVYGPQGRFATMNGQTLVKAFIPLPGAQAIYTSASLNTSNKVAYYRHLDHLGSSRLATTPTKTLYSSTAYAPYGEPYAQAGTTDLSFTGQDTDTIPVATNGTIPAMYDFLLRKHTPVQGRWLSPDPAGLAVADPTNPQSWNRYGYVLNNPMAMIDPFGDDSCYNTFNIPGFCDASSHGGPPSVTPGCSGWCSGPNGGPTWNEPINPNAIMDAGERSYMAALPWFQVIDGHLIEKFRIWTYWDSDKGTGYLAEVRLDRGLLDTPASNGSWLDQLVHDLKHSPVVLSVIVPVYPFPLLGGVGPAVNIAWNPDTNVACVGGGAGLSGARNVTLTSLTDGKMFNGQTYPHGADSILNGWSISGGYTTPAFVGYGGQINGSGVAGGPAIGVPGGSLAATYSACGRL